MSNLRSLKACCCALVKIFDCLKRINNNYVIGNNIETHLRGPQTCSVGGYFST